MNIDTYIHEYVRTNGITKKRKSQTRVKSMYTSTAHGLHLTIRIVHKPKYTSTYNTRARARTRAHTEPTIINRTSGFTNRNAPKTPYCTYNNYDRDWTAHTGVRDIQMPPPNKINTSSPQSWTRTWTRKQLKNTKNIYMKEDNLEHSMIKNEIISPLTQVSIKQK